MSIVTQIESMGIVSDNFTSTEIDPKLTIFTGHNGVGKSTLLIAAHSCISGESLHKLPKIRETWAVKVKTESVSPFILAQIPIGKISTEKAPSKELNKIFRSLADDNIDTSEIHKLIAEVKQKNKKRQSNLFDMFDGEAEGRPHPIIQSMRRKSNNSTTKSALYINEKTYDKGADEPKGLSKNTAISNDLALRELLTRFSQEVAKNKPDISKAKNEILKLISELKEANLGDNETQQSFINEINVIAKTLDPTQDFSYSFFLENANKFFKQTNRTLTLDDSGKLEVALEHSSTTEQKESEKIPWALLSKGEKILLTLLLFVYLNKDSISIFFLDEPDLSLHIGWQKILMPTLIELASDSQFVISTHSPAMIGTTQSEKIINLAASAR